MVLTDEIQRKVTAAQANSEIAATESVRTNQILVPIDKAIRSSRTQKYIQVSLVILAFLGVYAGSVTYFNDIKNTQYQQGIALESHSKRLDNIDTNLSSVQEDTSFIKGVIQGWQVGPLQPVHPKTRGEK